MTGPRDLAAVADHAAVAAYRERVLAVLMAEIDRLTKEANALACDCGTPAEAEAALIEANNFQTALMIVEAVPQEV